MDAITNRQVALTAGVVTELEFSSSVRDFTLAVMGDAKVVYKVNDLPVDIDDTTCNFINSDVPSVTEHKDDIITSIGVVSSADVTIQWLLYV